MFADTNGYSLADIAAATGNNNDGWGGSGSWIWAIIIIFALFSRNGNFFGGSGNGNGGFVGGGCPPVIFNGGFPQSVAPSSYVASQGAFDNYVLTSDFSQLSRQLDTGIDRLAQQSTGISNGLCDGFYAQAQLVNGVNQNISTTGQNVLNAINASSINAMQDTNALTAQINNCCCENRAATKDLQYAMATQNNVTDNLISTNFGNLRYDMAASDCAIKQTVNDVGRNLVDVQNGNTQAILAAIQSIREDAKDEKIATLTSQLSDARLIANNNAQTAVFTSAINDAVAKLTPPVPVPAFAVPNPWNYGGCSACGC